MNNSNKFIKLLLILITLTSISFLFNQKVMASVLTLRINYQACQSVKTITVELRSTVGAYSVIAVSAPTAVWRNTPTPVTLNVSAGNTPYYIVVKSDNTIETWSSNTITFPLGAASYDFTTAVSQAYHDPLNLNSPQVLVSGLASLYQGDIDQNSIIELYDIIKVYNEMMVPSGSLSEDLDCDGFIGLAY